VKTGLYSFILQMMLSSRRLSGVVPPPSICISNFHYSKYRNDFLFHQQA